MKALSCKEKGYDLDSHGFLMNFDSWDEDFAEAMARDMGIEGGLNDRHKEVIDYIRAATEKTGRCPLVFETCRECGVLLGELRSLFPSGYLRGACRIAGLSYRESYVKYSWPEAADREGVSGSQEKTYRIDGNGFLVDPAEWDEGFARLLAAECKMVPGLSDRHFEVLYFLRRHFARAGQVPTIYDTCEAMKLDLPELEALFPEGYQRGAVKLAGLRVQ